MLDLHAFTGHVVRQRSARRVVAPPYDALDPRTREAVAATDPDSYLGALPPGTARDRGALEMALTRCRDHLTTLLAAGRYRPIGAPCVGVLELRSGAGGPPATAIIGDVPVAAFGDGRVLPHERVDSDRVDQLARYLEVVGVASSPIALTQEPDREVTAATRAATSATTPDVAFRADDGVDVGFWCVTGSALGDRLRAAVDGAGVAYIADGHHRAAAAARYAASTGAGPEDAAGRVLCAVMPTDHLDVRAFHRRVDDVVTSDGAADAILDRLRRAGVPLTPVASPRSPDQPHTVTLVLDGSWWHADVRTLVRDEDVVEALDVRLVERDLLPLLQQRGRPVPVAVPVPAPLGLGALVRPGTVGIALYPPTIEHILAVAREGRTVPPKTTYVAPKLRSGLLVTLRPAPGVGTPP
ncbi:MAG: DUF1015 family protein [Nitriliruptor sp.]